MTRCNCEGWTYEQCNAVADITLEEYWPSDTWLSYDLCVEHVKMALDGWPAEYNPAVEWKLRRLIVEPTG